MRIEEIQVVIDNSGEVRIEVDGVKGMACTDLTAALEAALCEKVGDRQMKPEAYEQETESVSDQAWVRG